MPEHHVCPVWVGCLLASPLRKVLQSPQKILRPYIKEGMKVLDIGCAMGFFSLPLAKMIGPSGKVICVDLQKKMIEALEKRGRKAGLLYRIETRICTENSLELDHLDEEIDFTLAFAVVHEVPDANNLFSEVYKVMKPGGKVLVAEPKGRVSENDFDTSVSIAEENGFQAIERLKTGRSYSVLLEK